VDEEEALFGSRLPLAFSASLGDYFSMVVAKFNHDSPCEARARGWNAGAFGILHILGGTAGFQHVFGVLD
jgi:hypothetical protein